MRASNTTTANARIRVPVFWHLDIDCPLHLSKELTDINYNAKCNCFNGIRHSDLYLLATPPKSTNLNPSWYSTPSIAMNFIAIGWLVSSNHRKIGFNLNSSQIPGNMVYNLFLNTARLRHFTSGRLVWCPNSPSCWPFHHSSITSICSYQLFMIGMIWILSFSFTKMHLKLSSAKVASRWDELRHQVPVKQP